MTKNTKLYVVRAPYNYPSSFKDELYSDLYVALAVAERYAHYAKEANDGRAWEFQIIVTRTEEYDYENNRYYDETGVDPMLPNMAFETVGWFSDE
tara:strand:- start:822 stop:1106 length:285 start_codon:yes stop_codon:yes gene_type:complete